MLRASPADSNPPEPSTTPITRWVGPLREFIGTENSGAIVLLVATLAALVWANSPWADNLRAALAHRARRRARQLGPHAWTSATGSTTG